MWVNGEKGGKTAGDGFEKKNTGREMEIWEMDENPLGSFKKFPGFRGFKTITIKTVKKKLREGRAKKKGFEKRRHCTRGRRRETKPRKLQDGDATEGW